MNSSARITPVILSGGSGTRLWPMSRPDQPKQFLPLTAEQTMFELTLARAADPGIFTAPVIVAGARHAAHIETQLEGRPARIILEPCARNTAPAIALAALMIDGAMLVMPSDQVITDVAAFMTAIEAAMPLVDDGWLVTFGISPNAPETGYGYIQCGEMISSGVHDVARFVEKPPLAEAEAMIASGDYMWNGGIFLFRSDAYLRALAEHAPEMLVAVKASMASAELDRHIVTPGEAAFAACPADSIDYAVMEKAQRVAVVPVSMGWSDIGSWDALHDHGEKDECGNVTGGDVVTMDSHNNLIRSDGLRISVSGVSDLIIIASGNDVMILPRGSAQDVKAIANQRG